MIVHVYKLSGSHVLVISKPLALPTCLQRYVTRLLLAGAVEVGGLRQKEQDLLHRVVLPTGCHGCGRTLQHGSCHEFYCQSFGLFLKDGLASTCWFVEHVYICFWYMQWFQDYSCIVHV